MRNITAGVALLAAVASACTAPSGSGTTTTVVPPDAVVLTVAWEGGFVPVEFLVGRGPRYVLLADGRLVLEGPVPTIYPGPLLPSYVVTRLDEATMERVGELVDEIGFAGFDELRNTDAAARVADAATDVVTWFDANGPHVFAVYALGLVETSDPRVASLAELVRTLERAASSGESEPYEGDRLIVHVAAGAGDPEFPDTRPWPLPDPPGALGPTDFDGWECAVYEGEEAQRLIHLFSDATQVTTWTHDGVEHRILARPLLPGETGCD